MDAFTNPALKSGRVDVISPLSGNLRKALQVKREGKKYWARSYDWGTNKTHVAAEIHSGTYWSSPSPGHKSTQYIIIIIILIIIIQLIILQKLQANTTVK